MSTGFIGALLDFLITPLGIVAGLLGLALVASAQRYRRAGWFLFALCCFAASLGEIQNEYILQAPPLVFPLEQIRSAGRPLTALFLVMLLVAGLQSHNAQRRLRLPPPVKYILLVQAAIVLKTLYYGSISFALLTLVTVGSVVLIVYLGPSRWLQTDQDFTLATWSVAMVGVVFLAVNLYQALYDIYPITFFHNRFLGTTGNPQHAGTLLAAIIPCLLFTVESQRGVSRRKLLWTIVLGLTIFALLFTGSRTGLLMLLTTLVLFYRYRFGRLVQVSLAVFILAVILLIIAPQSTQVDQIVSSLQDHYSSLQNTREVVWNSLWRSFWQHPILGVPLLGDRLFGYGESSWFGAAAALGLAGLIPLVLFGVESVRMILQLYHHSLRRPEHFFQCSAVMAGLCTLMVGSVFEAYLLGNLGVNVLFLLLYLSMGQYLLMPQSVTRAHAIEYANGVVSRQSSVPFRRRYQDWESAK